MKPDSYQNKDFEYNKNRENWKKYLTNREKSSIILYVNWKKESD